MMTSFTIGYCVTLPLVCVVSEKPVILRVDAQIAIFTDNSQYYG
jgi:hypothetical protein